MDTGYLEKMEKLARELSRITNLPFYYTTTGGGCDAFAVDLSTCSLLVTVPEGAEAPTTATEKMAIGIYNGGWEYEGSRLVDGFAEIPSVIGFTLIGAEL